METVEYNQAVGRVENQLPKPFGGRFFSGLSRGGSKQIVAALVFTVRRRLQWEDRVLSGFLFLWRFHSIGLRLSRALPFLRRVARPLRPFVATSGHTILAHLTWEKTSMNSGC